MVGLGVERFVLMIDQEEDPKSSVVLCVVTVCISETNDNFELVTSAAAKENVKPGAVWSTVSVPEIHTAGIRWC